MAALRPPRALIPLALLGACGGGDEPRSAPNVLLISLDSVRRDLLGAYGFEAPHAPGRSPSPRLDALAAEGVLLAEAYATTSWTLPSHMTLLTGLPELVHGVDIDYLKPTASVRTLAQVLSDRGYDTQGFFSGPYLDPRFGFGRGFDTYRACYGPELAAASDELNAALAQRDAARAGSDRAALQAAEQRVRVATGQVDALSHRDVSSASVVDAGLAALQEFAAGERPFFLFAHLFDPHYDYVPPADHDRFDPDYRGEVDGRNFWMNPQVSVIDPQEPSGRRRVADDRDVEHLRALYAGELSWTDSQVGRLLDGLEALGLDESTLVIVTSDHGDEFFEHGAIGHRRTLYEEVLRIPLLLRLPGVLPQGERIEGPVATNDVFGTVLELCGLPAVPGVPSRSLMPLIRGEEPAGERGLFGRLVLGNRPIAIRTPVDGTPIELPGVLMEVTETYRRGRLKVTRERRWPETTGGVPAGARAEVARLKNEARGREVLRWIDVVAHPDEAPEDHSEDFSDPAARAVLREFHDRYLELLRERRSTETLTPAERQQAGMAALGYASSQQAFRGDLFVLPPPGQALLREDG